MIPENGTSEQTSNTIPFGALYMPFASDNAQSGVATTNEPYLRRAPLRCRTCNAAANKFCVVKAGFTSIVLSLFIWRIFDCDKTINAQLNYYRFMELFYMLFNQ